jgi:hypothetical protein
MRNHHFFVLLIIITIVLSCRRDKDVLQWDVDAFGPILQTDLDITDLVPDSNLTVDNNGLLTLVLRQKLYSFSLKDIMEPFDYILRESFRLDSLQLGNQNIELAVSLGYIAQNGGLAGALIIAANGNSIVIPPLPSMAGTSFPVDAGQYFQSLTLLEGTFEITFDNGLPIDITDLIYEIRNNITSGIIIRDTIPYLPAGSSVTRSKNIDGVTIDSDLTATLVSIESPGSNGQSVLIDTSDALNITISLKDLKPSEATAIWPAQNLINDTPNVYLSSANGMELTFCTVRSGEIFFEVWSTVEDTIYLNFEIPEAKYNGIPYKYLKTIQPAPPNGSSYDNFVESFQGYAMDLTGKNKDTTSTFYDIIIARIDSTGQLIHLSLEDSLVFQAGISQMVMNYARGYLGDTVTQIGPEYTALTDLQRIQGGTLDLTAGTISLRVHNQVGAEAILNIQSIKAYNSKNGTVEEITWNGSSTLNITRAVELSPGVIQPTSTQISFDQNNSNIIDVLENLPTDLSFEGVVSLNPNGPASVPDFIYYEYGMDAYLDMEFPLHFGAANILLRDTSSFNWTDIDPNNRVIGGILDVLFTNTFPIYLLAEVHLLDENGALIDVLVPEHLIQSGEVIPATGDTEAVQTRVKITVDNVLLEKLRRTHSMAFSSKYSTYGQVPQMIFTHQKTNIKLIGDFRYRVGN